MRNLIIASLTLGLAVFGYAKIDKEVAADALDQLVEQMEFHVAPGTPGMPNLGALGGPKNEVVSVEWGKTYTEKFDGETWTVYVANAVVKTYHGRYRVKAGVGLIEKGDEVMMRSAFDPVIEQVQPTKDELAEEAAAAERAQFADKAIESLYSKWSVAPVRLPSGGEATSSVNPAPLTSNIYSQQSKPFTVALAHPTVRSVLNPAIKSMNIALSENEVSDLSEALSKFSKWSAAAKENGVTDVTKLLAEIGNPNSDMAPGVELTFVVDGAGVSTLQLYSRTTRAALTQADAESLSQLVTQILSAHSDLQSKVGAEADRLAKAKKNTDDLFK